ncbi:GNA1162 family protein [uncultured Desulfobacter sp.]|uniref:GNA1162 family protein n=1 Tax=uncultured Desulfobacter sp. TaxID=240139 RepID=UPI0029F4C209|nr:GNA1162 family protein [uncultured Desulfobacter sp.]
MYEESPLSILILPPMNESTAADAKEYYSTTIQEPLAYAGYYTFPYPLTTELLKMEGIYDSELLTDIPLAKFKEYFGADAVLFTTIKQWDLCYMVIASNLTVSIDCVLKSTSTDQELWKYNGTIVVDLSGGNSGGGIAGLIASAIVTAVNTAIADYVPYARQANYRAIHSLPYGKYHPQHNKDQNSEFIDQTPPEETEPK